MPGPVVNWHRRQGGGLAGLPAVAIVAFLALACASPEPRATAPPERATESAPAAETAPPPTIEAAPPPEPPPPPPPPPPPSGAEEAEADGGGREEVERHGFGLRTPAGEEILTSARERERPLTAPPPAPPEGPPLVDKSLRFVRIFYGTNRARTEPCAGVAVTRWDAPGGCRPSAYYGGLPADDPGDGREGLEVGTLAVTFPPGHEPGKIERPLQVFSFDLQKEDPEKHVVISELRSFADQAAWARHLRATGRDQVFIYVHGFETTFDEAARRTAQLAYDLDFDVEKDFRGVPMLFSWPSFGELDAYGADYDASFESREAFNRFLDLVKEQAGIRRVHVIAHSMGNRVVTEALYDRRQRPAVVDQLVLAAPDVWASAFKRRFLRTLPELAARVTLYVSDQDRALIVSSRIRKGKPRAGQVAGGLLQASRIVPNFDAINATTLRSDFLGHSYYATNGSMLSDIYCLLKGTPPEGRPLLVPIRVAWQFRPPAELARLNAAACRAAAALPPGIAMQTPAAVSSWLAVAAAVLIGASLLALAAWWLLRRRRLSRTP